MSEKVVLITGCSSGFGKEMVSLFLENHWRVIATLRNANERKSLFSEEANQYGDRLRILNLDVTSASDRAQVLQALSTFPEGRIDCLINNAGYGLFGALEDVSEAQLREQFEVNYFGTVLLTQALLPNLRKSKGRIINLSSVFGFTGFPLTSAYCASKFAVEGFSESLRLELKPFGVQVCCVEPGGHRTGFSQGVIWGDKSNSAESPYFKGTSGYAHFKDKMSESPRPQLALGVASDILRVCESTRMPARLVCGKDAKFMSLLRHSPIGSRLAEFLISLVYKKRFMKGNS